MPLEISQLQPLFPFTGQNFLLHEVIFCQRKTFSAFIKKLTNKPIWCAYAILGPTLSKYRITILILSCLNSRYLGRRFGGEKILPGNKKWPHGVVVRASPSYNAVRRL